MGSIPGVNGVATRYRRIARFPILIPVMRLPGKMVTYSFSARTGSCMSRDSRLGEQRVARPEGEIGAN